MSLRNIAIVTVSLAALAALYFFFRNSNNPRKEKDLVFDYNAMEPRVAEKIRRLHRDIEENPGSAAAWGKLGMTLDIHGFNQESIGCYKRAAELDPKDFRWAYYCAIALTENASSESMRWFQTAIEKKPDYVPLHIRYAQALFDAGKLDESTFQFKQVIQLSPGSADAYVGLAQIAMQRNDIRSAKEFAEKAVELNPRQVEAYNLLATLYRRLENTSGAKQAMERAKGLPQKSAVIDPVYSALVAEGESAFWYRTRGRTYMDSGLYLLALREFKTALEIQEDADAYDNLGAVLQRLAKWEEAVLYHKKAIAMSPGSLRYYNLGVAYGKLNKIPEAIDAFQNSVRLKPDNPEAFYNLGVAYYKLEAWEKAAESLKTAIERNPAHANSHFALGMVYLAMRNRELALQEYEILKKLNPDLSAQLENALK